jgi:hypothetical protein
MALPLPLGLFPLGCYDHDYTQVCSQPNRKPLKWSHVALSHEQALSIGELQLGWKNVNI